LRRKKKNSCRGFIKEKSRDLFFWEYLCYYIREDVSQWLKLNVYQLRLEKACDLRQSLPGQMQRFFPFSLMCTRSSSKQANPTTSSKCIYFSESFYFYIFTFHSPFLNHIWLKTQPACKQSILLVIYVLKKKPFCVLCRRLRPRLCHCGPTLTGKTLTANIWQREGNYWYSMRSDFAPYQPARGLHQPFLCELWEPCSVSTGFVQTPGAMEQLLCPLEPLYETTGML